MKTNSLKYNFAMNSILTISQLIFPIITFPYISRVLQVEGTGKVAFAISVITYFQLFASLGIPTYGIKQCAQVRDDKNKLNQVVHELVIINMIATAIAYVILIAAIFIVPQFEAKRLLIMVSSTSLILNVFGVAWFYSALEKYTYITVCSLFFKILAMILMFLFVRKPEDCVIYAGISVISNVGANIFNFFNLHKYISFKKVGTYNLRRHLKPIFFFFGTASAVSIYTNLDTIMLGFIKDDTQVGLYNVSIKIKAILQSIVGALGGVLLPRLSYYIENKRKEDFLNLIVKALEFVFVFSIPLVLYFVLQAKETIAFISGSGYEGAVVCMQIMVPIVFINGISGITGTQIMVPYGREKILFQSVLIGALVDFILNVFLIYRMGAVGAAIATVIAEIFVTVYQIIKVRDIMGNVWRKLECIKICAASSVSTIVTWRIKMVLHYDTFGSLLITSFSFFAIYMVLLVLMKETTVINVLDSLKGKMKKLIHH